MQSQDNNPNSHIQGLQKWNVVSSSTRALCHDELKIKLHFCVFFKTSSLIFVAADFFCFFRLFFCSFFKQQKQKTENHEKVITKILLDLKA